MARMLPPIENPNPGADGSCPWSERTLALCRDWQASTSQEQRNRILSELWVLINGVLTRYVRLHSQSLGLVDAEEVRDIASEKAMAFLQNLRHGARDIGALHAAQVSAYVSVLARNGLIDVLRRKDRRDLRLPSADAVHAASVAPASDEAEVNVRHEQFLSAICQCVSSLAPRARTAWFFRAFLDMSSKDIAAHPEIRMTVTAVDMLLSRTRRALAECMKKHGLSAEDAPPGTFVALWDLMNDRMKPTKEGDGDAPTSSG